VDRFDRDILDIWMYIFGIFWICVTFSIAQKHPFFIDFCEYLRALKTNQQ
jgi:hypothetical protein